MTFKLSLRSRIRMGGMHPDLVKVVERAIQLTTVDFMVRRPGLDAPAGTFVTRLRIKSIKRDVIAI